MMFKSKPKPVLPVPRVEVRITYQYHEGGWDTFNGADGFETRDDGHLYITKGGDVMAVMKSGCWVRAEVFAADNQRREQ